MAELGAENLRCRVELLHRAAVTNDLGVEEIRQVSYDPPRRIWASITPSNGHREYAGGNMDAPVITHLIQVRRSSLPKIPSDLVLRYRGQDYELQYGYPNYQRSGFLDLYCKLVIDHGIDSF